MTCQCLDIITMLQVSYKWTPLKTNLNRVKQNGKIKTKSLRSSPTDTENRWPRSFLMRKNYWTFILTINLKVLEERCFRTKSFQQVPMDQNCQLESMIMECQLLLGGCPIPRSSTLAVKILTRQNRETIIKKRIHSGSCSMKNRTF